MVINSAQDELAIGVPVADRMETSTTSLLIARLDLKRLRWVRAVRLDPPSPMKGFLHGRYLNAFRLMGTGEIPQIL